MIVTHTQRTSSLPLTLPLSLPPLLFLLPLYLATALPRTSVKIIESLENASRDCFRKYRNDQIRSRRDQRSCFKEFSNCGGGNYISFGSIFVLIYPPHQQESALFSFQIRLNVHKICIETLRIWMKIFLNLPQNHPHTLN